MSADTLSLMCAVFHDTQHVPLTTSLSIRQLSREPRVYRWRKLHRPINFEFAFPLQSNWRYFIEEFLSAVRQLLSGFRASWKHFLAQYEALVLKLWTISPNALFQCQAKDVDFSHPLSLYDRPKNNLTLSKLDIYWDHDRLVIYCCFNNRALSAHLTVRLFAHSVHNWPYNYAHT